MTNQEYSQSAHRNIKLATIKPTDSQIVTYQLTHPESFQGIEPFKFGDPQIKSIFAELSLTKQTVASN